MIKQQSNSKPVLVHKFTSPKKSHTQFPNFPFGNSKLTAKMISENVNISNNNIKKFKKPPPDSHNNISISSSTVFSFPVWSSSRVIVILILVLVGSRARVGEHSGKWRTRRQDGKLGGGAAARSVNSASRPQGGEGAMGGTAAGRGHELHPSSADPLNVLSEIFSFASFSLISFPRHHLHFWLFPFDCKASLNI